MKRLFVILSRINSLGLAALGLVLFYSAGSELIRAYVESQFAATFFMTVAIYLLFLGFSLVPALVKGINFPPGKLLPAFTAAALVICLALAAGALVLPGKYHRYIHGHPASTKTDLRYRYGPFLQFPPRGERSLDTGAITVWWFDPFPGSEPPALEVSPSPDMAGSRIYTNPVDREKKRRGITLKNLVPGKKYYYRIPGFDSTLRHFTFPGANNKSLRFTVIGDASNDEGYRHGCFRELVPVIKKFHAKNKITPEFLLYVGDIADSGNDIPSWEYFLTGARPLMSEIPGVMTLGNHEMKFDRGGNWDYLIKQPRYSAFDAGPVRFIVLHNFNSFSGINGLLDSEQYRFLESELKKAAGKRWIVVAIHVSPVSTGDFNMNQGLMNQYLPLFKKYRVDLVLAGHDHHFEAFRMDRRSPHGGTFIVINGGGGSRLDSYIMTRRRKKWKTWYHDRDRTGLYQDDPFTAENHIYGELSWGFCEVEVKGDTMRLTYYRWLELPRFLKLTGQKLRLWRMRLFSDEFMEANKLWDVTPMLTLEKKRQFGENN